MRQSLAGLLLIGGVSGCQCCPLTEHYADAVDHVASHEHCLDALYHPSYDLTRIGRPDWCQSRINRMLCPSVCERRKPLPHIIETSAANYVGAHHRYDEPPYEAPTDVEPSTEDGTGESPEQDAREPNPYFPPPTTDDRPIIPSIES